MTKQLRKLIEQYEQIEKQIRTELEKMQRYGQECNCETPEEVEVVSLLHHGNICTEILSFCLRCGGYLTPDEML